MIIRNLSYMYSRKNVSTGPENNHPWSVCHRPRMKSIFYDKMKLFHIRKPTFRIQTNLTVIIILFISNIYGYSFYVFKKHKI